MNLNHVERIAEAVLYEGYMLYPYRPSSVKNQQRWNFGVLYPQEYSEQQKGIEPCEMQTECLVKTNSVTRLTVKVRFLQIVQRQTGRLRAAVPQAQARESAQTEIELVDDLEVDGRIYQPWQEAVEQEISFASLDLASPFSRDFPFTFPEGESYEQLRDESGELAGVLVRTRQALSGTVQIRGARCRDQVVKVTVRVRNRTILGPSESGGREAVLLRSLVSTHTILGAENGEFLSLLEPPPGYADLAGQCVNLGTYPVLADGPDTMLSSPIILYDHPQIAPESAGNLFDSTEIDEILSLRILTLTDDEKREMRQSDERTRRILERTECMPEEQFMKLHGVLRGLAPVKEPTP